MSGAEVADVLYPKRRKFSGELPRLDPYEASISTEKMLEVEAEKAASDAVWAKIVEASNPPPDWTLKRS